MHRDSSPRPAKGSDKKDVYCSVHKGGYILHDHWLCSVTVYDYDHNPKGSFKVNGNYRVRNGWDSRVQISRSRYLDVVDLTIINNFTEFNHKELNYEYPKNNNTITESMDSKVCVLLKCDRFGRKMSIARGRMMDLNGTTFVFTDPGPRPKLFRSMTFVDDHLVYDFYFPKLPTNHILHDNVMVIGQCILYYTGYTTTAVHLYHIDGSLIAQWKCLDCYPVFMNDKWVLLIDYGGYYDLYVIEY